MGCKPMEFDLPSQFKDLCNARDRIKEHYRSTGLQFTFDGNLVGDIGEALAAHFFGVVLTANGQHGIDGTVDGKTVQVKATGKGLGPAFRYNAIWAHQLLFFSLDFDALRGCVIYNGPEAPVRGLLPKKYNNQRVVNFKRIVALGKEVPASEQLKPIIRLD